jgi:hypothetical protein
MAAKPEETFLAVLQGGDLRGVILTQDELSLCQTLPSLKMHICSSRASYRDVLSDTCLGALFSGKPKQVHELCPMTYRRQAESLLPVGPNRVAIVADQSSSVEIFCRHQGYNERRSISAAGIIEVAAGCKVVTSKLELSTMEDITPVKTNLQPAVANVSLGPVWDLIHADTVDSLCKMLDEQVEVANSEINNFRVSESAAKTADQLLLWTMIMSVTVLVIIITYLIGCGIYVYSSRKKAALKLREEGENKEGSTQGNHREESTNQP